MRVAEKGVLAPSRVYFNTPSEDAKNTYFYTFCTGKYACDSRYEVSRNSYDSFLLLYILGGSGYLIEDGARIELRQGALLLLDCYSPHRYGTQSGWEILWLHFDGAMARQYYNLIRKKGNGCVYSPQQQTAKLILETIYTSFHEKKYLSEACISGYITDILTLLADHKPLEQTEAGRIDEVLRYISDNLDKPMSVSDLAERASFSEYYFIRLFRRETGSTPHEYIVSARISMAKFYLKTTSLRVKQVAARCGFNYESSFCTAFLRSTGYTPKEYKAQGG